MNQIPHPNIMLSVRRALSGEIFPELLAVAYELLSERSFKLLFFLDQLPSEEQIESISIIETEVIADFPSDFEVSHQIISGAVTHLPNDAIYVYLKKSVGN